jgi:hypothetical protein
MVIQAKTQETRPVPTQLGKGFKVIKVVHSVMVHCNAIQEKVRCVKNADAVTVPLVVD